MQDKAPCHTHALVGTAVGLPVAAYDRRAITNLASIYYFATVRMKTSCADMKIRARRASLRSGHLAVA